jgi:hypothetical protein
LSKDKRDTRKREEVMFSTLKRMVAVASTGLALFVGGVALSVPAASAQPLNTVSVSGIALCGTRFLPSGTIRYQPAQSVRYGTRNEVQSAPVQFNGHYFLTLHRVPRQGEQAVATVFCRNLTRFSQFVFINGFNRFQTHNLVAVTRVVRGRP